ncbi:(Fe-S)-binding protein [Desulfothermobacter acidiphilus]|uniref:(Fe-S)-binding protein n=1 Tax=Desulfothermobacter acidiphilus TaxID=1938353 RepID=UPI003F8AB013
MTRALEKQSALEETLIKCMKCGNCQAVCPIYQELKLESATARGKIRLAHALLRQELPPTPAMAERFDLCLTCLACESVCPSGVKVGEIILASREILAKKRQPPPVKRALYFILRHPPTLRRGTQIASRLQKLAFRSLPGERMQPRFPLGLDKQRVFPALAPRSLLDSVPEQQPVDRPVARVALFAGCLINYLFPSIGLAALYLLQRHRVEVLIPPGQHCCGAPLIYGGEMEAAREMARSHVKLFSSLEVDAILTLCGTCGEAWQLFYPQLLRDDPNYGEKASSLARRSVDIARFLHRLPLNQELIRPLNLTVTYHHPCHLGRGLGVKEEPLELLSKIPGLLYRPLREPERCCGNAGAFSLTHYPLSRRILSYKLEDIANTDAQVVLTGCPACRMQLLDGITQKGMPQVVWHTVELLARACGFERRGNDKK